VRTTLKQRQLNSVKKFHAKYISRTCRICKDKVIKEDMYKVKKWDMGGDHWVYFCMDCVPSENNDTINPKQFILEYKG
jgi:hypothetical protein